ncbi:MAG: hypothetical protein JSW61_04520 [Candidatus Thorarchaeota archaeon]|nr:MAG: hypothetical protein JSW61_04520 [Candidatus Thorarchaeota archaeon]
MAPSAAMELVVDPTLAAEEVVDKGLGETTNIMNRIAATLRDLNVLLVPCLVNII